MEFKQLIEETMEQTKVVTELFYQQRNQEAFNKYDETLTFLARVAEAMFQQSWVTDEDKNAYLNTLKDAMNALEEKDSILLSDILNYELMDYLETLKNKVL